MPGCFCFSDFLASDVSCVVLRRLLPRSYSARASLVKRLDSEGLKGKGLFKILIIACLWEFVVQENLPDPGSSPSRPIFLVVIHSVELSILLIYLEKILKLITCVN